jgi:hypothetical protein
MITINQNKDINLNLFYLNNIYLSHLTQNENASLLFYFVISI